MNHTWETSSVSPAGCHLPQRGRLFLSQHHANSPTAAGLGERLGIPSSPGVDAKLHVQPRDPRVTTLGRLQGGRSPEMLGAPEPSAACGTEAERRLWRMQRGGAWGIARSARGVTMRVPRRTQRGEAWELQRSSLWLRLLLFPSRIETPPCTFARGWGMESPRRLLFVAVQSHSSGTDNEIPISNSHKTKTGADSRRAQSPRSSAPDSIDQRVTRRRTPSSLTTVTGSSLPLMHSSSPFLRPSAARTVFSSSRV